MTLREWIAAGCPSSFTKARNKGRGRVEKAVVRALHSKYVAPTVAPDGRYFEVVTIEPKGRMHRDVYLYAEQVASRLHTSLDGEGVVTEQQTQQHPDATGTYLFGGIIQQ